MWPEGTRVKLSHGPEAFIEATHLTRGLVAYTVAYWTDDGSRVEADVPDWEIVGVASGSNKRSIGFRV